MIGGKRIDLNKGIDAVLKTEQTERTANQKLSLKLTLIKTQGCLK